MSSFCRLANYEFSEDNTFAQRKMNVSNGIYISIHFSLHLHHQPYNWTLSLKPRNFVLSLVKKKQKKTLDLFPWGLVVWITRVSPQIQRLPYIFFFYFVVCVIHRLTEFFLCAISRLNDADLFVSNSMRIWKEKGTRQARTEDFKRRGGEIFNVVSTATWRIESFEKNTLLGPFSDHFFAVFCAISRLSFQDVCLPFSLLWCGVCPVLIVAAGHFAEERTEEIWPFSAVRFSTFA